MLKGRQRTVSPCFFPTASTRKLARYEDGDVNAIQNSMSDAISVCLRSVHMAQHPKRHRAFQVILGSALHLMCAGYSNGAWPGVSILRLKRLTNAPFNQNFKLLRRCGQRDKNFGFGTTHATRVKWPRQKACSKHQAFQQGSVHTRPPVHPNVENDDMRACAGSNTLRMPSSAFCPAFCRGTGRMGH